MEKLKFEKLGQIDLKNEKLFPLLKTSVTNNVFYDDKHNGSSVWKSLPSTEPID